LVHNEARENKNNIKMIPGTKKRGEKGILILLTDQINIKLVKINIVVQKSVLRGEKEKYALVI
jgi:hypothetical protein